MKTRILLVVTMIELLIGCKYDNEEELLCSTSNITYLNTIKPLIETRCASCHSGPFPEGGYRLTDTAVVNRITRNDTLYKAVTTGIPVHMPLNGPYLSDCEIRKIQAYKTSGLRYQ